MCAHLFIGCMKIWSQGLIKEDEDDWQFYQNFMMVLNRLGLSSH